MSNTVTYAELNEVQKRLVDAIRRGSMKAYVGKGGRVWSKKGIDRALVVD